jgi:hypothetical protein
MWLFWIWGVAALVELGIAAVPRLVGWAAPGGDSAIVGFFALVVGLPAWLVLAALTITRWRRQSRARSFIQVAPTILAAVVVLASLLKEAT